MRLNRLLLGILPLLISSACVLADKSTQQFLDEGNVFLGSGKFNDALESFDAAIAKDPSNYLSYFRRATTYLSLGRNSAALDDFSKILQLKPDFEQALLQRTKIYLKEGQFELATKDLKKYLETKPKDDIAGSMLTSIAQTEQEIASAENKLKNGEHEECIQLLSSAINTVPQLPKLRLLRARCHIAKGEIEEAAGDFSRAAYINPSDRELLITLATMNYYSLYEPQVALAHIKQCLHYDPEDKACKALFRKLKKYEKDVSKVDEDLVKKRFATAVNKLVGSGERIGLITEVDEEVNVMEKEMNAVGKMPKRLQLKLYKMACRIYSEQKDTKNTLKWCDKTLKIDENDTDALMSRGEMYLNDELYEEAVRELNKANESVGGQNQQVKELLNKAQRLLKQSQTKDYYKILGVTRQADKREIRKAYRKLAQIWHPDKYTGDLDSDAVEKKMSDINQAYEVLSNDEMRAQFDNGEDPFDSSANQSPFGHGGHPFGGHPFGGHPFGGGQFPQGFQFEFKF